MRVFKQLCLGAAALAIGMGSALAADKPTLKIGYVNGWDDSVAVLDRLAAAVRARRVAEASE